MTVTLLGGTGFGAAGSTMTHTVTASAVAGDDVIVCGVWNDNTRTVNSVADSAGNTYTVDHAPVANGAATVLSVYRCTLTNNITAASTVITWTLSGSCNRRAITALAVDDLDVSPLDANPTATTGSDTSPTSPASGTLAQADEFILATYALGPGTTTTDFYTPEAGWTEHSFANSGAASANKASQGSYKIVSSTTSETESGTTTVSNPWVGFLLSYKIAGGGGGTTPQHRRILLTGAGR